jgi:hypothetical protein
MNETFFFKKKFWKFFFCETKYFEMIRHGSIFIHYFLFIIGEGEGNDYFINYFTNVKHILRNIYLLNV